MLGKRRRAWGELDPNDPLNSLIQDIQLAKDPDGKVRYVATFVITRPVDTGKASGMLWHEVPNRGRPVLISTQEREFGDIGLATAWQGDNAGMSASLEERYGDHAGYVEAVRKAVHKVQASGFLLERDGAALIKAAEGGKSSSPA